MSSYFVKVVSIVTALMLLVSGLSACDSSPDSELRIDVSGGVDNLDPQFATGKLARTIIANTMEGLLVRDEHGAMQPAGAAGYSVSPGLTRYTFELRRDAKWSNGDPVTAQDYAFAFWRIFNNQAPSPYAENFSAIKNAAGVLAGELPLEQLGVRAVDSYTLEIELEKPSPSFLEKLSDTAAMPCNSKFFESTRARYGLGIGYMIYNGPFRISKWDNTFSIVLRPNGNYHTPTLCSGVVFYTSRLKPDEGITAYSLFSEGKSDIYEATAREVEELDEQGVSVVEIENMVWQLVLNTEPGSCLENTMLRRAVMMSLDRDEFDGRVPSIYGETESLIPSSARPKGYLMPSLLPYNSQWAMDSIADARRQLGEEYQGRALTLLLPEDAELTALAAYMQKQWRTELSLYVDMEAVTVQEQQKRILEGDFTLTLVQATAYDQSPAELLESFCSGSYNNFANWHDDEFDELMDRAGRLEGGSEKLRIWEQAEQLIIDRAAAMPLFSQSSYFALAKGITGVELAGGRLDFRNAVRLSVY